MREMIDNPAFGQTPADPEFQKCSERPGPSPLAANDSPRHSESRRGGLLPIPTNVYYSEGNFYYCGPNAENRGKGMGNAFFAKWRHRSAEFPERARS